MMRSRWLLLGRMCFHCIRTTSALREPGLQVAQNQGKVAGAGQRVLALLQVGEQGAKLLRLQGRASLAAHLRAGDVAEAERVRPGIAQGIPNRHISTPKAMRFSLITKL